MGKKDRTLPVWKNIQMKYRPKVRYWLPAAAVDEDDLRLEIKQLCERGFGGIEVVVLSTLPKIIACSEDGWGTLNWNKVVSIIADETKKRKMSLDIAIGPGWPIASPEILSSDDPAVLCELTYGEIEVAAGSQFKGQIPKGKVKHLEGMPILIHVMAYQEASENVLIKNSYMDLVRHVYNNEISLKFPLGNGRPWKLFAFYQQPACQMINSDQNYVVDHLSLAGAKACEKYWEKIFEQYSFESMESFFCDSLEYQVSLEWTPNLLEEFLNRRGYDLCPYLPFLGISNSFPPGNIPGYVMDKKEISDMINRDYLETITQCYCEYHLRELEKFANQYGKNIRYQVAYNKPFEVERCGLYVGIPENEALGRPAIDYMKTMTAAVHLGRKERHTFECSAEFSHAYGQSYEDLFWWIKRSLMSGMNGQVLHGASYSGGYHGCLSENGNIPNVNWPGYEGFGKLISNNWNRTPDISQARGCMDAIARLNTVFSKTAKIDCAVYKDTYGSDGLGGDHDLYPDGGALIHKGYSWEFISEALLELPICSVKKHILDDCGPAYKCLIIPETEYVSIECLKKIIYLLDSGFPIIWQGNIPTHEKFYKNWKDEKLIENWKLTLKKIWSDNRLIHIKRLEQIPEVLMELNIFPEIVLDNSMQLITAVRKDIESKDTYAFLYGYNAVIYSPNIPNLDDLGPGSKFKYGTMKDSYERPGIVSECKVHVKIKGHGRVYICNYWNGLMEDAYFRYDGQGFMEGDIFIQEDELLVFMLKCNEQVCNADVGQIEIIDLPVTFDNLILYEFKPDTLDEVSFLRSSFLRNGTEISLKNERLKPWKDMDEKYIDFVGKGVYEGTVRVNDWNEDHRYILELGDVCDTFVVQINGKDVYYPDQIFKRVDITSWIHFGINSIKVTVVSNLYNCLYHEHMLFGDTVLPYRPRAFGIWESNNKKIRLRCYKRKE